MKPQSFIVVSLLFAASQCGCILITDHSPTEALNDTADKTSDQQEVNTNSAHEGPIKSHGRKCSRKSVLLASQSLMHQLDSINNFNFNWFNDLDKEELLEGQKQSLGNMIMSESKSQLLNSDNQPLFEIEASYFRQFNPDHLPAPLIGNRNGSLNLQQFNGSVNQPISFRLLRRQPDRCYLNLEKAQYTYMVTLIVGPIEHHLDLVYNLPKELRLSQPIDWKYAQVRLIVPKMHYEITLKQVANYKLNATGCPLEVADVTYLSLGRAKPPMAIAATGLAATNQTFMNLERLFNDYTRPVVSSRVRQVLKFSLNSKTLPLSIN